MPDIQFIKYLKTLPAEDWEKKVTADWDVKNVVAHMIGWDRGDVDAIKTICETKQPPSWKLSGWGKADDDAYNAKWIEYYKDYTPTELIIEWEKWQAEVRALVNFYGEENLRARSDLFDWLFEGVEDNRKDSTPGHYKHHYNQLKQVLE